MTEDELADAEATVAILIGEELAVQHRLEGHGTPMDRCPVCRAHGIGATA